ncbi:MAG: hypothetical protein HYX97_01790 [Chloroflexi bacterium]|nr:hypothetical protein [Chloroflexota bacterium]
MGQLRDKLARIGKGSSAPIGFGALVSHQAAPALLLIAELGKSDAALAARATAAGADAVLVTGQATIKNADGGKLLWGMRLDAANDTLQNAIGQGCAFLLFSPDTAPAAILREEAIDKVLAVEGEPPDTLLRMVDTLPVDALYHKLTGDTFTVQQAMGCARLARLADKPLLVALVREPSKAEMEALRDAGALGLVLEVKSKEQADRLKDVRQALIQLAPPRKSRETGRRSAVLPSLGLVTEKSAPPPPDEDDEP